ncbi:MAG: hypothetical protein ACJ8EY_06865 [Sphingomicrobium sp.]
MPLHFMIALAATTATPVTKPRAVSSRPKTSVAAKTKPAVPPVSPIEAMAMMMKVFDKFFPAGSEPDPVRLAAARENVMTMFPKGAYAQALNGFMDRTVDHVLNMSEADFAGMLPPGKEKKDTPPSTEPLRVMIAKKEPNFDAKLAAVRAFASTMFVKFGDAAEPKFREGMSRALARKFDAAQLAEIRTFLATPTGAAYGREMVGLWFEPDVMRGTFQALPEIMKMMPELTKDAADLDAQMKATSKPTSDKQAD